MDPDDDNESTTRILTIPNTSSFDSANPKKKDVNERIADLESTIKKLQLELIDLTSQQECSKESSKINMRPKSKLDSTMHFDHVNLTSDYDEDINNTVNQPNVHHLNQHHSITDSHSEDELNTLIFDLKAELQAKLQDLKDVFYDDDDEELVKNLSFNQF